MRIDRRTVLKALRLLSLLVVAVASGWLGYEELLYPQLRGLERQAGQERAMLKALAAKHRKAATLPAERTYNRNLEDALQSARGTLAALDDDAIAAAVARLPGAQQLLSHSTGALVDHEFYTERAVTLSRRAHFSELVAWLQTLAAAPVLLAPREVALEAQGNGIIEARVTVAMFSVSHEGGRGGRT